MSLDNLAAWARFFDSASGGSWLLALALVTLTMAVAGLTALALRLAKLPSRHRPARSIGCQRYNPDHDERDIHPPRQIDQILSDELGREADRLDAEWQRINRESQ